MEASADKQVAGSNRPLASAQKKRIKMREKEHVAHGTLVSGTPWIQHPIQSSVVESSGFVSESELLRADFARLT